MFFEIFIKLKYMGVGGHGAYASEYFWKKSRYFFVRRMESGAFRTLYIYMFFDMPKVWVRYPGSRK
ncbi:MAG: hypothetical protein EAZ89_05125 [Bacteroidetes bacterium]|nr:MAG: hypothetical protein EAZ89_05125 [Bacteroidota bacterium]